MKKRISLQILLLLPLLSACGELTPSSKETISSNDGSVEISASQESVSSVSAYAIDDVTTTVYGSASFVEHSYANPGNYDGYTFAYSGENIRIEKGIIQGLKANTATPVTVTNPLGQKASFTVNVANRAYVSKHESAETKEGWFKDISIDPVTSLSATFANGMDISSVAYLYERGARFYNADGIEQSLFQILKEAGVNWVRFRLWVDPTNPNYQVNGAAYSYGGGRCDFAHLLWMAKEAKAAGLDYLLDFHYSDFYTDPSHQIIPKSWASLTTASAMADEIYQYTQEVLAQLKAASCLPSCVQVGNEVTRGLLTQVGGTDKVGPTSGNPDYVTKCTEAPSAISGTNLSGNFHWYIYSALKAVHDTDSSIQTMIHFAKGFSDVSTIEKWVDFVSDLDFDIIGLSGYAYWHWATKNVLTSCLSALSEKYPTKKICLVETAYGFTYESASNLSPVFSASGDAQAVSSYAVSIQGQAEMIRDATIAVSSLTNGWGVFYWEPAWIMRSGAGWADLSSTSSWANQGLFSYEGKALGSLEVYKKMEGK
jgi:arabinogalactan endo-1,4-beta-galactosidase